MRDAPNAIVLESKQFATGELVGYGWAPSLVLTGVVALFVYLIWTMTGMPVLAPKV